MSHFKKISDIDNQSRIVLKPVMENDNIIRGELFSSGPYGVLPLTGDDGNTFPILESFDKACDHVGDKGTVFVHDPDSLWAPEWPPLT